MKTHWWWLTASVSSNPLAQGWEHEAPSLPQLKPQGLIGAKPSLPQNAAGSPLKAQQLTEKQTGGLGADHCRVIKVFAQLIFLLPIYQTSAKEAVAVCHHQGRCSADKRAAKQCARFCTCHLRTSNILGELCTCAYTVPMPYPVCNTEPCCTACNLQPCFVI